MNGFTKHGLDHTSASQINMYANAPCAWAAKYLYGRKFSFANAAKAGVYVEDAVVDVIANGEAIEDAVDKAVKRYNKEISLNGTDSDRKRGEGIQGMIELAVQKLSEYGQPEFDESLVAGKQQKKVELVCNGDGWSLPVIGYLDFYYPQHKLVIDLKSTMRMPSSISIEHERQGAIYKHATGFDVKFLYVTPKKSNLLDIGDTGPTLKEIKKILERQEKMLRQDAETIKDIMPINTGSFYWHGSENIRKDIYDI